MGVRLYPNTRDRRKLERLAGVPHGTYDRLDAVETAQAADKATRQAAGTWNDYDDGYRHWCQVNDDPDLNALAGLLLSGWGKFRDPEGLAPDCAGSIGDPTTAQRLLDTNGIVADATLCEGVHWC